MILQLFGTFLGLLLLSFPIFAAQGIASLFLMSTNDVISQQSFVNAVTEGLASFTLVAVPLFTFAGDIMGKGGISKRLLDVAKILFGNMTGGLGIVSIVACMLFSAISGTGSATVAAIGLIMIPLMVKDGYDKSYGASLVATAGTIGVIIPPSVCLVVYAVSANTSVSSLFTAGIPTGVLIGVSLCIYAYISSKKNGYRIAVKEQYTLKKSLKIIVGALPAFAIPVIVLGVIYGGHATPTEAAAIACALGILLSVFVYKEVKLKELPYLGFRAVWISTPVVFVIGLSSGFGRILAITQMPTTIAEGILSLSQNPIVIILLINLLLLIVGAFMETNASIIILTPILLPIVQELGYSAVHFGIIMVFNLAIGFITPPLGANLFMAAEISGVPYDILARKIWPWIIVMIVILMIITYIPEISLFLPRMMGMST